jgi:integrase/recombinase XerD
MSYEILVYQPTPAAAVPPPPARDRTDELIVRMWISGKAANTQRGYAADARRLFEHVGKALDQTSLEDLQSFAEDLQRKGLSPGTRKRILAAVKSLFTFAADIRHLQYNVAAALRLPKAKDTLNERILSESQVSDLVAAAEPGRNRLILELLYLVGLRAEELTSLCWRDARADSGGAILTVFGKGSKTRHLRLDPETWALLGTWRGDAARLSSPKSGDGDPVFASREGGGGKALSTVQVWRIVSRAAKRAGLKASPHWLRHCHASHAIDHGCDLRTLQQSLGHASSETTERYIHSRPRQSSGAFVKRPGPPAGEG